MRLRNKVLAVIAALSIAGCAPTGFIYTQTVQPLDVNLNASEFSDQKAKMDVRRIQYSYFAIQWGGHGLAQIAKAEGFKRIYYTDLETLSVLGVWTQQWVLIYGEREVP